MKWAVFGALAFGVFLAVCGDDDHGSLDFDLPDVDRPKFPNIPGFENLPINTSALPSPEEAEKVFKEKCLQNGGEEAYRKAKDAKSEAETCVRSLVNYTELMEEMEHAKPIGDLDTVFRKYCRKSPDLKKCIMNFIDTSNDCLTTAERGSKQLVQNVTDQLLSFVCFKEGDRIALFIAESGPECISDKKEAIFHCINSTFGKHLPAGAPSINALPQLLLGADECNDVCSLQHCVVKELEKCKEPTPANIVESMFNYVLKVTPCTKCRSENLSLGSAYSSPSNAISLSTSLSVLCITSLLAFYV